MTPPAGRAARAALLALALTLSACGEGPSGVMPGVREMRVASTLGFCMGMEGLDRCLIIDTADGRRTLFAWEIEGFRFEGGYEYDLLVLERVIPRPPADGSDRRWTLVEQVARRSVPSVPRWADVGRSCAVPDNARDVPATARDSIAVAAPDVDDALAELTRDLPAGFGGTFGLGATRVVRLVDVSSVGDVLPVLADRGVIPSAQALILPSRWTFAQLRDWRRLLAARLADVPGLDHADLDEVENRVVVRYLTEEARLALEQRVRTYDLPCHLLAVGAPAIVTAAR